VIEEGTQDSDVLELDKYNLLSGFKVDDAYSKLIKEGSKELRRQLDELKAAEREIDQDDRLTDEGRAEARAAKRREWLKDLVERSAVVRDRKRLAQQAEYQDKSLRKKVWPPVISGLDAEDARGLKREIRDRLAAVSDENPIEAIEGDVVWSPRQEILQRAVETGDGLFMRALSEGSSAFPLFDEQTWTEAQEAFISRATEGTPDRVALDHLREARDILDMNIRAAAKAAGVDVKDIIGE
jgi:hypothetical protein